MDAKKNSYKRSVKIPTPQNLTNVALYYLSRFSASENSLRRVLQNRIRRAAMRNAEFSVDTKKQDQLRAVIETIIEQHRKSGALNDAVYAETKVASMRRMGRSRRTIQQKLVTKGVARSIVEKALKQDNDEEVGEAAEMKAAMIFAKRRKIGCFRTGNADIERKQKEFAMMARAGFAYDIAKKIVGGEIDTDGDF